MTNTTVHRISVSPADLAWEQDVAGLGNVSSADQRLIDLVAEYDLTTIEGARALVANATSEDDWRKLKNAVRAAHSKETFQSFWLRAIIMTGDSVRIRASWA